MPFSAIGSRPSVTMLRPMDHRQGSGVGGICNHCYFFSSLQTFLLPTLTSHVSLLTSHILCRKLQVLGGGLHTAILLYMHVYRPFN